MEKIVWAMFERFIIPKNNFVIFGFRYFRGLHPTYLESVSCNFLNFEYFLMISKAFDAETPGLSNASKNIKNGSVVEKLS